LAGGKGTGKGTLCARRSLGLEEAMT